MLTRRVLLASTGAALLAPLTQSARAATQSTPILLRFPRPTGPFQVRTTELHLVDHDRDDLYVPGRPRELMISVWYP